MFTGIEVVMLLTLMTLKSRALYVALVDDFGHVSEDDPAAGITICPTSRFLNHVEHVLKTCDPRHAQCLEVAASQET